MRHCAGLRGISRVENTLGVIQVLTFEFEEPSYFNCACCGRVTIRLTRFVYSDGDAHAVYYAQFTAGHPQRRVSGLVGLGGWGEGTEPADRVAFPFELWTTEHGYAVGLVDASECPWRDVTYLGRLLDRDEALEHDLKAEALHITDHIVNDDPEIKRYFGHHDA